MNVIGVHIDTSSVHAAQVADYKGKETLIKAAAEKIKADRSGDFQAAISTSIKAVLSHFSLGRSAIVCTFHDPQVFVRKITTPPMPLQELGPAVRLAVKNAFPFSLDEAVLDFRLVNKFSFQGKERLNVLVAACPQKNIDMIRAQFGKIKIASCIPAAIALENLLGRSKFKTDETLAVIALGPAVTELVIYKNSHLEFSRKLSISVEDIIKSMTGSFFSDTGKTELTFEQAQAIENEYGIPKPDGPKPANTTITPQEILMLIGPKIEGLATEINRSLDYYREELQGGKVDRILLVGESSRLKRLDEFLSEQLGLEVAYGDLLEGMQKAAPQYLLAVGSALGGAKGINLLSKRTKKIYKIEPGVLKIAAITAMVVPVLGLIGLNAQIQTKSQQVKAKDQELVSRLAEVRDTLAVRQLEEARPSWGEILKAISRMPGTMYLEELNLDKDQLLIKGEVTGKEEDSDAALVHLISNLRENSLKDARVKFMTKVKDTNDKFEFEIVAGVEAVKQ